MTAEHLSHPQSVFENRYILEITPYYYRGNFEPRIMSSDVEAFPPLSGGIPTKSQDLAASIIFCLAFAL